MTDIISLSMASSLEGQLGAKQWQLEARDVGEIVEIELGIPDSQEEACVKSVLLSLCGVLYEVRMCALTLAC